MGKDVRFVLLIVVQLVVGSALAVMISNTNSSSAKKVFYADGVRDAASKLRAAGLVKESVVLYEKYLIQTKLDGVTMSNISYAIAQMYEELGQKEQALGWYYQVATYDENSKFAQDANLKIVSLLETLKKYSAAKAALNKSVKLEDDQAIIKGAKVIAEIGPRKIYDYQMLSEFDNLPPQYKKSFSGKDGKTKFLQKYVADEILLEKAKRLQLNIRPEYVKQLEKIKKQLLLESIYQDEVKSKISLDETDVKNYFKANREKFSRSATSQVVQLVSKSKADAKKIVADLKSGKLPKDIIKNRQLALPYAQVNIEKGKVFADLTLDDVDTVLKVAAKKWSKPILARGKYSIFFIENKFAAASPEYEKIKEMVKQSYQQEKSQGLYQDLISNLVKAHNIKIYPENIK